MTDGEETEKVSGEQEGESKREVATFSKNRAKGGTEGVFGKK